MSDTTTPSTYKPTLRDLICLDTPADVKISPDGRQVISLVQISNWKENCYETLCQQHVAPWTANAATRWITRSGSVRQAEWLDNHSLALLKKASANEKPQVWVYEDLTGDGWQITDHKTGVNWFKPFAGGIIYQASNPEKDEKKERTDQYGQFTHFEHEESASALYYIGLEELRQYQAKLKACTEDEVKKLIHPTIELSRLFAAPLSIQSVIPSPATDAIYINCQTRDDLVYYRQTQVLCIHLDAKAALQEYIQREQAKTEKDREKKDDKPASENKEPEKEDMSYLGNLTHLPTPPTARVAAVSPDGKTLLVSYQGRDQKMYTYANMWLIDASTALQAVDSQNFISQMHNISAALDREALDIQWSQDGIYASYVDGTLVRLARFSPDGKITPIDFGETHPFLSFHVSDAGHIAMIGFHAEKFPEIFVTDPAQKRTEKNTQEPIQAAESWKIHQLSNLGHAVENWELGSVETIRWNSKDGVEIEGVLRKPANFDPGKKYPLVFVVHGGPTWFSACYLVGGEDLRYYPSIQFVNRDILVLKPNYRGSIGRGQAFSELNVDNLGIGDLWDLESAIDYLDSLGYVDTTRIGCMGWSQGGYISAFAGLHSKRFRAVSVGAGISDWYTYHISNDIPEFTTDYLSASPFRNRDIYIKTAPISNLENAKTPMLIQHGSDDQRVPLSNATELYRGLKEMGIDVELFIFPGMGHPITRPRENHAVMDQNLTWFLHYLLGDERKF